MSSGVFRPILVPNLWFKWKNFILINAIIRPFFDVHFTLHNFMSGAKQALVHISERLADGDINSLNGLIDEEALNELKENYKQLNAKHELMVRFEDIMYSFVHQIGILMDEKSDKRWVEITVVYYCLYQTQVKRLLNKRIAFKEYKDFEEKYGKKITICNYRFIREYTKGVDSEWTVNLLGHFQSTPTL